MPTTIGLQDPAAVVHAGPAERHCGLATRRELSTGSAHLARAINAGRVADRTA